jgi:hypothetical protein
LIQGVLRIEIGRILAVIDSAHNGQEPA